MFSFFKKKQTEKKQAVAEQNMQAYQQAFYDKSETLFQRLVTDSRFDFSSTVDFDVLGLEYFAYCFAQGRIYYLLEGDDIKAFAVQQFVQLGAAEKYSQSVVDNAFEWLMSEEQEEDLYAQLVYIGHNFGLQRDEDGLVSSIFSNTLAIKEAMGQ